MRRATSMAKGPWASNRRPFLHRLRRDESGQALILVMFISVLSILMLTTATTALTSQIRPAAGSVDAGRAMAAAQAGVENFLSWVNTNCPPNAGYLCANLHAGVTNSPVVTDPTNQQGTVIAGADGAGTTESYYWTVVYAASGFARVRSVGQVPTGKSNPKYRTTTLVADINAVPSFNNFQYYTKYETYSPDFLNSFYGQRTVQITPGFSLAGTSISTAGAGGSLNWSGVCSYDATTNPGCDQNHSTNICNDLYYPNPNGSGRGTDTAWNNSVRRPSATVEAQMGTDNSFAYYSEPGTYTPSTGSAVSVTHNDVCDSTMEPNMVMNGPIYSQDAYLVDRAKDTGSSQNSMPDIGGAAYSVWNGVINSTQQAVGANGGYDRAYPGTNGQAYLLGTYPSGQVFPIYESNVLDLPADASDALPEAACVYTGPTRIKLSGNIAYITSPLTPAGTSACYQSTGSFSNVNSTDSTGQSTTDPSGGVINAQVPINSTIIYVKNAPASVTRSAATKSNPIFSATTSLSLPAATTSNSLAPDSSITNTTLYTQASQCPTVWPATLTKQGDFDCETGKTSVLDDTLSKIKAALTALPASSTQTTATVQAAVLSAMNSNAGASLSNTTLPNESYYVVTVGTATASTPTPTVPATHPAFYQGTDGKGYTTSTATWPITISRYYCSYTSACSGTSGKGSYDKAQTVASGSYSQTASTAGSPLNTTENFPWFGKTAGDAGYDATKTYTDMSNDVTQYYHGYGDVYVEGTLQGEASILAEHDIVLTNDVKYSNTTLSGGSATTDGLALVATHNVRIYRPMTCVNDGTLGGTTAGYCPDDTTGVFTDNQTWPVAGNFPSNMYKADSAPSMTNGGTSTVYATIFALRGSFMADNFYRGSIGSSINIYGGLYQYHRGATSLPYQGRPYQGSTTKMPGIVVNYNYDNMRAGDTANGGLRIPYIPTPQGRQTANTWNVVGISTGS